MKNEKLRDPYLYEDVPVLRNKAEIKDKEELTKLEGILTKAAMNAVYATKYVKFNTTTIQDIHKQIFGGLFDWAGEFRSILIVKAEKTLGGDTVRYAYPGEIKKQLDDVSKKITKLKSVKDKRELVIKLARITAAIWQTHPFREGNTRTIVSFAVLLANHLGVKMNNGLIKKEAAFVRDALVVASQGIYSDYQYIERIFLDAAGVGLNAKNTDTTTTEDENKYKIINGYDVSQYEEKPHSYVEE